MSGLDGFNRRASSAPERQPVRAPQPLLAALGSDQDVPFKDVDKPVVAILNAKGDLAPQRDIEQVERCPGPERPRAVAARSSRALAKRSDPYGPCEQKRETVSSGRCATLAAGSTNFLSTLPGPLSRSPCANTRVSAQFG